MAFLHGKRASVLFGRYNLSRFLNDVSFTHTIETGETTTFEAPGSAKTYVPGLRDATITLEGLFDGSAGAVDEAMRAAYDTDSTAPFTFSPGAASVGGPCYLVDSHTGQYEVSNPVGDVVAAGMEIQAEAGINRGRYLAAGASVSSSSSGAAVDNTTSSAAGAFSHLHVTANTLDAALAVKVQHSADNATWVDLMTFTSVPAGTTTSQRLAATGTINRYLRASYTTTSTSGSATVHVALSRR